MKYRFLVLTLLFFLGNGCDKDLDWDFNEPIDVWIEGDVLSYTTKQGIEDIKFVVEGGSGWGTSSWSGHFAFRASLDHWTTHYMVLERVDTCYQVSGYLNGVYQSNIRRIDLNLSPLDNIKIELIEK